MNEPHAVPVVEVAEEDGQSTQWNTRALEDILLKPKYADKKVVLVSVVGAYRKGKSFLLNFFLRFMVSITVDNTGERIDCGPNDWLSPSSKLGGFSWRHGCTPNTKGILIWSEPFLVKNKNGEEVVVLLMDTQGTFDSNTTMKDCATIFALSALISSVQIYNVSQNIQEDDLQHLQLFTEYGRLVKKTPGSKPFQSLTFLIRDWSYPDDAGFGFEGGQTILNKRLEVKKNQHAELQQLRQHIRGCFEEIQCFLLPHPGLYAANNSKFDGNLDQVEPEFKKQLQVFVPKLLHPDNLVLKKVNNVEITCRELLEYFKAYMTVFQGEDLPELKTVFKATAEVNNMVAVKTACSTYKTEMGLECGEDTPVILTTHLLSELHKRCRDEAIKVFNDKKMGDDAFTLKFLETLEKDLEDLYIGYERMNSEKRLRYELKNQNAITSGCSSYRKLMEQKFAENTSPLSTDDLLKTHNRCRNEAIKVFNAEKIGGDVFTLKFLETLEKDLEEKYNEYEMMNNKHVIQQRQNEDPTRTIVDGLCKVTTGVVQLVATPMIRTTFGRPWLMLDALDDLRDSKMVNGRTNLIHVFRLAKENYPCDHLRPDVNAIRNRSGMSTLRIRSILAITHLSSGFFLLWNGKQLWNG